MASSTTIAAPPRFKLDCRPEVIFQQEHVRPFAACIGHEPQDWTPGTFPRTQSRVARSAARHPWTVDFRPLCFACDLSRSTGHVCSDSPITPRSSNSDRRARDHRSICRRTTCGKLRKSEPPNSLAHYKGCETRPRPRHGANAAVSDPVPDPIAVTVPPLVHHENLSPVERVKAMRDARSDRRIVGAGCIR